MATTTQNNGSDLETQRGKECVRCQGPTLHKVYVKVYVDWVSVGGHLSFPEQRCLLCGDITDSLILSHRVTRPKPDSRNTRHQEGHSITAESIGTRRQNPRQNPPNREYSQ